MPINTSIRFLSPSIASTGSPCPVWAGSTWSGLSFFFRINQSPAGGTWLLWSTGAFGRQFVIQDRGGGSLGIDIIDSAGVPFSANYRAVIGSVIHVAMAWESGRQAIYINGSRIASDTRRTSIVGTPDGVLLMGCAPQEGGNDGDFEFSGVALWSGYAPTDTDVMAIRDHAKTPAQVGPGAAMWLSCVGSPGRVFVGSEGVVSCGRHAGAGYNLASVGGTGRIDYTANAMKYANPVAVIPYVTKCGKWLACLATQAAINYPLGSIPKAITAVVAKPGWPTRATLNGRALTLYGDSNGDPWWNAGGDMPEAYWQLCCGSVESTVLYDGGSGYAVDGTVATAVGGNPTVPATFGCNVSDGVIKSIPVTGGGVTRWGQVLSVVVTGGGGKGFRGICLTGPANTLSAVQVLDGGENYSIPFSGTVSFVDVDGNAANDITIGPVVVANGVIKGFVPNNGGGMGYTSLPTLVVSGQGGGINAAPIMTGASPTDKLTISWDAGFLRTPIGAATAAVGMRVVNYAGQDEALINTTYNIPGWGKVPWSLFGPATKMRVGTNLLGPTSIQYGSAWANWAHRQGRWPLAATGGSTTPGMTADGYPTTLGDTGSAYTLIDIGENLYGSMGPDFRGTPLRNGAWTVVWDDASPIDATTPRTLMEWLPQNRTSQNITVTGPFVVSTGTLGADGVLRGIVHSYEIEYPDAVVDGSSAYGGTMCLYYTNTTTRVNTAVKGTIQLIPPGNPVPLPLDTMPDAGFVAAAKGCGMVRNMKVIGAESGNVFIPDHITSASDHAWMQRSITGPISISHVRKYDTTRSPYIYLESCYGFDTAANRAAYATPPGDPMFGISPYRVPAKDPAFTWYATIDNWYCAECVTPVPHGMWSVYEGNFSDSGQHHQVTIENGLPGTPNYASVIRNLPDPTPCVCFVTGPDTFVVLLYDTTGLTPNGTAPGNANNISATGDWIYSGSGPMPYVLADSISINPPETTAGLVNALPGCVCHAVVPLMLSDDGVTAYATRLRDSLLPGHLVQVETGNENWNMGFYYQSIVGYQMGLLLGSAGLLDQGHGANNGFCTQRGSEVAALFRAAFNATDVNGISGRGVAVQWALGGSIGGQNGTSTSTQVDYCLAHNLNPDVFLANAYEGIGGEMPDQSDTLYLHQAASAAVALSPASDVHGTPRPLALSAYIDLLRHYFPMSITVNGPHGSPYVGSYHYILEQLGRLSPPPSLVSYEGAINELVRQTLSVYSTTPGVASDQLLPGKLTHDVLYHPAAAELISKSWALSLQNGGMVNADYFILRAPRFSGGWWDGWGRITWSISTWTGQAAGLGDGTDGQAINRFCLFPSADGTPPDGRSHDGENVNPLLLSWQTQATSTNPPAPCIVSTSPMSGSIRTARCGSITATFDRPVDGAGKWVLCDPKGWWHGGNAICSGNTITFTPASKLAANSTYRVTVSGVSSHTPAGTQVQIGSATWTFTTGD